jgi:hypothetical protein
MAAAVERAHLLPGFLENVMRQRTLVVCFGLLLAVGIVAPGSVLAQGAGIAGVVRDSSGGVLPGVTVEASSPALIEKVRTAVTDGQGLYNIINLGPGTYAVTFELPGFSTVRREGIELSASFTATVNADMRPGGVEETLTVTGEAPTVDIQNVGQQRVMTRAVIDALPTGTNSWQNLGVLIPGTTAQSQDVGGSGAVFANIAAHGGRLNDIMMMSGGMSTSLGSARFSNGPRLNNTAAMQEFGIAIGAHSAETVSGGVRIDAIPKDGGNMFSGSFYGAFTNQTLQSENLSDDLETRGLRTVDRIEKIYDINPGAGGPIKRDRLWFFGAFKRAGNYTRIAGMFANKSTNPFAYVADESRPAVEPQKDGGRSIRLTLQASAKHKVSYQYWDTQGPSDAWYSAGGAARLTAPEAISRRVLSPYYAHQATWSARSRTDCCSRRGSTFVNGDFQVYSQKGVPIEAPSITELRTGIVWGNFSNTFGHNASHQFNERFAASYVSGTHSVKVGLQLSHASTYATQNVTGNSMTLQLLDGIPSRVTVFAMPIELRERSKGVYGVFAQDQWRVSRMTLNLGVRYDHHAAYVPALMLPAGRFIGERSFPRVDNVPDMSDWSPRLGMAWDLFGDSRTAFKVNIAKYLEGHVAHQLHARGKPGVGVGDERHQALERHQRRLRAAGQRVGRALEQQLRPVDRHHALRRRNAAHAVPELGVRGHAPARDRRAGVGQRGVLQALVPQLPTATDNILTTPADFNPYCIKAPLDSRLPGGGGYDVCGLYDVIPALNGRIDNVIKQASNFGDRLEVFDGIDLNLNARMFSGVVLQAA